MNKPSLEQRMIENEVVFRKYNERVKKGIDSLRKLAKETGQADLILETDTALHFYCECSDESCKQRVQILPSQYDKIHKLRDQFVVLPGHETDKIEHVIRKEDGFNIVKKHMQPPKTAKKLNQTPLDNS